MPKTSANDWATRQRRERERARYIARNGNVCELCGRVATGRGLSEDHDHATGAHRGWLCHRCNRALPTWVNPAWLRFAALYLESSPTVGKYETAPAVSELRRDPA